MKSRDDVNGYIELLSIVQAGEPEQTMLMFFRRVITNYTLIQ